jgi:argininosuccinate lyase
VATDTRLYVKRAAAGLVAQLSRLIVMLAERAEAEAKTLLPAYTHLQRGMPSTLGHHLLAYAEMLSRDVIRIEAAAAAADCSPLGSGACAGTSLPIDRAMTAQELGFSAISANSLDAVSDRDFVADFLYAGAMLMLHLSRWGEEWVLWSTAEFGFLELDDRVTTGSSMMPNKKNPDGAELLRGKAGRTVGNLAGFLTTLKGLPFAYNKDLQEDKEPLFDTHRTLTVSLEVAAVMLDAATFRRDRMAAACTGQIDATDLCERIVRAGEPLRTAHHQTGRLVRMALERGCELRDLPIEEAREACPLLTPEILAGLSMVGLVNGRDVVGGPAPLRVREASRLLLQRWQPRLNEPT